VTSAQDLSQEVFLSAYGLRRTKIWVSKTGLWN
jgi:hypothetical protein